MKWCRDERIGSCQIRHSSHPSAHTISPWLLIFIGHVEERLRQVRLQLREGWLESTGEQPNSESCRQRPCYRSQVSHCIQLRNILPVLTSIFSPSLCFLSCGHANCPLFWRSQFL